VPTQFTSSRESRGKVQQKPEDFMDEEDYKVMGLGKILYFFNFFFAQILRSQ
jgi:hypothetical protein